MSFIRLSVDDADARRLLSLARLDDANLEKAFSAAALATDANVREVFRDEASPWGEAWAPHSDVTIQQRQRRGSASTKKLLDDGTMYGSLRREVTPTSFSLIIGGDESYPVVHQFGNPSNLAWGRGAAPIPPRPFFPIDDSREVDMPPAWLDDILEPFAQLLLERL